MTVGGKASGKDARLSKSILPRIRLYARKYAIPVQQNSNISVVYRASLSEHNNAEISSIPKEKGLEV